MTPSEQTKNNLLPWKEIQGEARGSHTQTLLKLKQSQQLICHINPSNAIQIISLTTKKQSTNNNNENNQHCKRPAKPIVANCCCCCCELLKALFCSHTHYQPYCCCCRPITNNFKCFLYNDFVAYQKGCYCLLPLLPLLSAAAPGQLSSCQQF